MRTLLKPTTQVEHAVEPRAETSDRRKYNLVFLTVFLVWKSERCGFPLCFDIGESMPSGLHILPLEMYHWYLA